MRPAEMAGRRPQQASGALESHPAQATAHDNRNGCPCGCVSRPPWDDPGCARHRPLPAPRETADYDVAVPGLVPHDRATCEPCLAAGR